MEAIASRLETITTSNKKLLVTRTLLGWTGGHRYYIVTRRSTISKCLRASFPKWHGTWFHRAAKANPAWVFSATRFFFGTTVQTCLGNAGVRRVLFGVQRVLLCSKAHLGPGILNNTENLNSQTAGAYRSHVVSSHAQQCNTLFPRAKPTAHHMRLFPQQVGKSND